jgi:tetratricopeptide (TPR) repeat protein
MGVFLYMKNHIPSNVIIPIILLFVIILITGCKTRGYDNFTTYFNTFYNEERLMKESESEFEFQAEKKRAKPKVLVPIPQNPVLAKIDGSAPTFLAALRVDKGTRQAVSTKLDSILIKGSKILAKSPKTNYVAPSLYLMAKAYFYKEEWLPSQIKCSELIDKEPTGKLSADAHLLMSINLLMQGKYDAGLTMLSRTVDVAWLNERYDILTKAFEIEAEMSLYYGDLEGAIRPYFQAIAQSDDNSSKALWQEALASILFRMHKFDRAEKAFAKVMTYSPDLVTEYESKLYRASCLIRLNRNLDADRILNKLNEDGKFEEWKDYVMAQRLVQSLLAGNAESTKQLEFHADSLYSQSQAKAAYYFEKGIQEFDAGNYIDARSDIAKARAVTIPTISQPANKIFAYMNSREIYNKNISTNYDAIENLKTSTFKSNKSSSVDTSRNELFDSLSNSIDNATDTIAVVDTNVLIIDDSDIAAKRLQDSINFQDSINNQIDALRLNTAKNYFELARLNYNIGNIDSANYYYKAAADVAPISQENSSRYLYVYSESIRDTNAWKADSILNVIVNTQPKSEYGKIALAKLGYTSAFITDTVAALYNSGYDLMKYKEYNFAIQKLTQIYTQYPQNLVYAPKSLYTLGYLYENEFKNFDSASYYYAILVTEYPNSVYSKELFLPVEYKQLVDNGIDIPDSLKTKDVTLYTADTTILSAPYDSTLISKPHSKDGFSFDDLKNPSKLLDKAKKAIQEKLDKAQEVIDNPDQLIEDAKDKVKEGLKEGVKIPKPEDFLPKGEGEEEGNSPYKVKGQNPMEPEEEEKEPDK